MSRRQTTTAIEVSSSDFATGQSIPEEFTCQGQDVSPPLRFGGLPEGTRALACIMDDPDAPRGTFTHWTFWNLQPGIHELHTDADLKALGAVEGRNDFGRTGYGGPCPPGGTHRYFFHVFALDAPLELRAGAPRSELEKAMAGHVLARGEIMGTYAKR